MHLFRRRSKAAQPVSEPAAAPLTPIANVPVGKPVDDPQPLSLLERARLSGDPFTVSPYFTSSELDIAWEWIDIIEPFLAPHQVDYSAVADFAAGHGRNSVYLLRKSAHLTIIDINQSSIEFCQTRFGNDARIRYLVNDGISLAEIGDNTISFLYSFDSMVHFDPDVIASYLHEFRRVLQPGGMGFCHHSNSNDKPGSDFKQNIHWRNQMSRARFAELCRTAGLEIVDQRVIDWREAIALDCLSLFMKPIPA